MTDLPPLPAEGDTQDDADFDAAADPWPVRSEWLAAALCLVAACTLAASVAQGWLVGPIRSSPLGSSSPAVSLGTRLRVIGQAIGPFTGLLALGAGILVALEGIITGQKRGPLTNVGRAALYAAVRWGRLLLSAAALGRSTSPWAT